MDSILDRIRRSTAQRGGIGTLQLCAVEVLWMVLPRFRSTRAGRAVVDAQFDQQYGVDTGGLFRPKSHQVIGKHWTFGCSYQPVEPSAFLQILSRLRLSSPQFTFLDLGSGKGRTLLLASLFPFKKIIGVDYCPELNQIARRNATAFRAPQRLCNTIEIHDADAAEYPIPDGPLVLFLYNPFSEQVMSQVVRNVARSHLEAPRRLIVIYFLPWLGALWETTGLFARTQDSPAIFDTELGSKPTRTAKSLAEAASLLG
jgi:SAM-dependent methyltransferase